MRRIEAGIALIAMLALTGCAATQGGTTAAAGGTSTSTSTTGTESSSGSTGSTSSATARVTTPAAATPAEVTMPNGMKYTDLKVGDGTVAEAGLEATVQYTGWLQDGTKFDSSVDRGQPITIQLGEIGRAHV